MEGANLRYRLIASTKEPSSFIIPNTPRKAGFFVSANTVDVLVFIPLIPAIPVIATWFLPWERWIPRKVPNKIIGPYLLYCAFSVWYFKQPLWLIVGIGLWGIVVCVMAFFDLRKSIRLREARDWPIADGRVLGTGQSQNDDGRIRVTLTYTYKIRDERYGGSEFFLFSNAEDADRFQTECEERAVKLHYQADRPEISVLIREEML
jgi:hypothetical protein